MNIRLLQPPRARHPFPPSARLLALAWAGLVFPATAAPDQDPEFPVDDATLAVTPNPAASAGAESSVENLRIAYLVDAWDRTERRQIHAQLDAWAPGFTSPQFRKCEFQVFEDEEALAAAVQLGKFDVVCLYAFQMPTLGQRLRLDPGLLIGSGNALQSNFVLLVRRTSGIDSIADLEGRKTFIETGNLGTLPMLWLAQAAKQAGTPLDPADRGEAFELRADSFNAVAPVFFGNVDACVITQQGFTENAGLNPQILQQLHVLAKSPPFATRVLAFPQGVDRSKKSAIMALRPSLAAKTHPGGFLTPQDIVLYDVADGDFDAFKAFVPGDLPRIPGSPFTGDPFVTRAADAPNDPTSSD